MDAASPYLGALIAIPWTLDRHTMLPYYGDACSKVWRCAGKCVAMQRPLYATQISYIWHGIFICITGIPMVSLNYTNFLSGGNTNGYGKV
jgi:hypothetical protein